MMTKEYTFLLQYTTLSTGSKLLGFDKGVKIEEKIQKISKAKKTRNDVTGGNY
jgi:hypothetical protein